MDHAVRANHRVLASVSRGYPRLAGSLITSYSPVRHSTHLAAFAFDLHASSTPPTFVLSQDQTLHLKCSSSFCRFTLTTDTDRSVPIARAASPSPRPRPHGRPHSPNPGNSLDSHAFFRGHPECQRSPRAGAASRSRAVRGAGDSSERSSKLQEVCTGFWRYNASCS